MQGDEFIHLRQIDTDAAGECENVAFERGTSAKRNYRHTMRVAQCHSSRDFFGRVRKDDGIRQHGIVRRFIAAVMLTHGLRGRQPLTKQGPQVSQKNLGQRTLERGALGRMVHG